MEQPYALLVFADALVSYGEAWQMREQMQRDKRPVPHELDAVVLRVAAAAAVTK